jgi:hypothetical protein
MGNKVTNSRKISLTIFMLLIITALFIVFYKSTIREYNFTGYAFKNEIIKVKFSNRTIKIVADRDDNLNELCFFSKNVKYFHFMNPLKLNVQIDSLNSILLDTVLILPNKNKKPVISFEDPTTNHFRRNVFLIDESDIVIP